MKKYKQNFLRDWNFYNSNSHIFNFAGRNIPNIISDSNGSNAIYCFFVYDSTGKMLPCCEPEILERVIVCKASINMNIKQWAEGRFDSTLPGIEFDEIINQYKLPSWVVVAVNKSWYKLLDNSKKLT